MTITGSFTHPAYDREQGILSGLQAWDDENLSKFEVILRENLPTSFTVRVSSKSPRYYTVIHSSVSKEFRQLETLHRNYILA
jgi:hypothetical protein